METKRLPYREGDIIVREGNVIPMAYLILEGNVQLVKQDKNTTHLLSILSPGDIIGLESLFNDEAKAFTAIAMSNVFVQVLPRNLMLKGIDGFPIVMREWFRSHFTESHYTIRQGVSIGIVYSICNSLYSFLQVMDIGRSNQEGLKGPMDQILDELEKTLIHSKKYISVMLNSLADVGLVDIREGDPMTPNIQMPNQKLYLGFLRYLQLSADLPVGMHENVGQLTPIELSKEAGMLLDAMLTDSELVNRMFEPERSIIHLSHDKLNILFRRQGNEIDLDPKHQCLSELEEYGAFTRIVDNQRQSVFANMRNVMRLNIMRDPDNNFVDIAEFLCSNLANSKQTESAKLNRSSY